ncbi:WD repeat-containing protein [Magnaporthiopsis poae ATCC 64411]|uniref:WD repeat-containing protein n=1 Tax=Magnaporthiopsis poae (strain ATCC 64411 / 73-15) TaxID=644358 RepID=A0A0C4DJV6_MAGP6|nr:WD repeat-containing protein [Magnaporthiopsis poae ATCC 64411]
MSKSSDPGHFFESDAQQAKRERRDAKSINKYGNPVALKSKILAAIADPRSSSPPAIFVAESAGSVRHVKLSDEPDTKTVYRGPSAPVTCVAVGGAGGGTLFAGSWDKSIWSWDLATGQQGRKYTGHTDFVKTVVCARLSSSSSSSREVLISGGADKRIIVWDALAIVGGWVVTAGRDEDLKFWDRASGELHCTLEGHYDEVTDLMVLSDGRLCSVGIDGTVRTWPVLRTQLDALVTQQREAAEGKVKEPEAAAAPQEGVLSAEEEAELAALMDDD